MACFIVSASTFSSTNTRYEQEIFCWIQSCPKKIRIKLRFICIYSFNAQSLGIISISLGFAIVTLHTLLISNCNVQHNLFIKVQPGCLQIVSHFQQKCTIEPYLVNVSYFSSIEGPQNSADW